MKKLILSLATILLFSTPALSEELIKFDVNPTATVYFIKKTLIQENETVRSVWVKYVYTSKGSEDLRKALEVKKSPASSKVKYGFDCTNSKHKVFKAVIYDSTGSIVSQINNAPVDEVVPGTVAESIRNTICNYDINSDTTVKTTF